MAAGVLSLDLATLSGWAFGRLPAQPLTPLEAAATKPAQPLSGVHRIAPPGCSIGHFLHQAEQWLWETIERHDPAGLIYEAPILDPYKTGYDTAIKLMGLAGVCEMVAMRRGLRWVRNAQPSAVKKHFCGSGRPGKDGVKNACRDRGWTFQDDNEADALAIWDFAASLAAKERRAQ